MTNLPKCFIIILQFNNSGDTICCLESVKELQNENINIIIVDNASGSVHKNKIESYLKNETPNTKYTYSKLSDNIGYSGGNNVGINTALKQGADYILILNPDTVVKPNLLDKLIKKAESDSKIGIVGPAINEGGKTVYGGKIKWLRPELSHSSMQKVDYIIGSSMLIKKEVFEKIGFLDEKYFLYFEDADFSARAKMAGFKLSIEPTAIVDHKVSSSTSQLGSPILLYYHYRNSHLFNFKNGPFWSKILLPFWSFYVILKQLAKIILVPKRREVSRMILKGVTDFYMGRFGKI
ncbi:MAG: hypothetical protein COV29_01605 [Candidatus Yanofskybacteria bacterium CG10_big_fil_rev_8_21_14_0_10_36_16]|uniref:Glycosyltransferase 2-like domain-containing protein n=1 Tax=Candidatus Yanofskybacteria bacterium CG10_big_fil_rev_8_21_14_0_10_36_16 TaxID=1975096 RepID=A0A2J0Q7L1_9BACT|nr:MAG: hypothetical protein COV29_01605 [Candidatus Yanofskybacteria bacterium CG10_big_fil_rev_8_21_14_0_10_36_16]